jgi:carboxyl-terminal processing protease
MKKLTMTILLVLLTGCIDDPVVNTIPGEYQQEYTLLWNLFNDEYVGFALKQTDWDALFEEYLAQAQALDSREEMTALTIALLGNLEDCNVSLFDPSWNQIPAFEPEISVNFDMDVLMSYLEPGGYQWMQTGIWGYCLAGPDSVPYFVVSSWDPSLNISLFDNVLLPLLEEPGVIIDLRMNSLGAQGPASNFVRRFVDQIRVGHMDQERSGSESHELADPVPVNLIPRGWHFQGQVVLLTGETNSGVCEMFICDMGELPNVISVGDTTLGAGNWSFQYRELVDGWRVSCPTLTLLRADSTPVEGNGVPPDIFVDVTEDDFQAGIDPVLEYAFEYLNAEVPSKL